jgi:cellulose synthase/poly-beta-1,6-N-acetylglucosamine synthase-like glycosyltransferase
MADNAPQTFANHTRWDPLFHFFLIPVFVVGLIMTLIHFFYHFRESDMRDNVHSFLMIVLAVALLTLVFKVRLYALKVQDRVIRLEERVRLMQLLSEPLRSRIPELTEGQLCGLRFASDGEIPKLVERALTEKVSRKDIKQAIQNWRPDYWRV